MNNDPKRTSPSRDHLMYSGLGKLADICDLNYLPQDIKQILKGVDHPLQDHDIPLNIKPAWYDANKFKTGQHFAQKYYFGLTYSEMLSLFILFSIPEGLTPLIFTGQSSTPFTAFKRYLSTSLRIRTWYEDDIWDKDSDGYKNVMAVRAMHASVSRRLNSMSYSELERQTILKEVSIGNPLRDKIQGDFQTSCAFQIYKANTNIEDKEHKFFSQFEMSFTQFGFFGLMILHPEKFGASNVTEKELEGFIHLWRCIGYLLGIDDEFNFCNGTLEDVRERCHCFVNRFAKPCLQRVSEEWEHMSRCMVEGVSYYMPGVTFEESLLFLCWVLDVPASRLMSTLSWRQCFPHYLKRMFMRYVLSVPWIAVLFNWIITKRMERAAKLTPAEIQEMNKRKYEFKRNE